MRTLAIATAFLAACGAARAADTFDIPVILSLTGPGAFLGKQESESLRLMEGVVNRSGGIHGRPVHFVMQDNQSIPQNDVQIATQLIAGRPVVIMGPNITADCGAAAPLMLRNGPVNYCFSAAYHPPKGSFVFSAGVSTRDQMAALVRFYRLKGITRLALATSTDATGQDGDAGFAAVAGQPENAGMQLAEHVHFNINDVSVTAQVERLKEANPQALIVWCVGSSFGTILRGIAQSGLEIPVGTTSGNMTMAQMQQFAAFLPKRMYFASPAWPASASEKVKLPPAVAAKQREFYAAYKEAGLTPDEGALLAWDPAVIVTDALRRLPEGATTVQLHDELLRVKDQPGVGGVYDFVDKEPQSGLSLADLLISEWDPKVRTWFPVSQLGGTPME